MARRSISLRSIAQEAVLQAISSIRNQRLRSFLTLLGIVIGVAPVIALVSIMSGFNESVSTAFSKLGIAVVQFQKIDSGLNLDEDDSRLRRTTLTIQDAVALEKSVPAAISVSPEATHVLTGVNGTVKNDAGTEANSPIIRGVWPSYTQVRNLPMDDGVFVSDSDLNHRKRICVLGNDVTKALYDTSDPIGKNITIGTTQFKVIGTLLPTGTALAGGLDNQILIPLSTWAEMFPRRLLDQSGALTISLRPAKPDDVNIMVDQAISALRIRHKLRGRTPNDFAYASAESELQSAQSIMTNVAAGVILVAAMALLVGGVGVMNIMLVNVTERTREIGVRKAMGATHRDILAQFLAEAIALTTVGGVLGLGLGLGSALIVRLTTPLPAQAPLWSAVLGISVSGLVGLTFGLWPALRAAKQDPIEALRFE